MTDHLVKRDFVSEPNSYLLVILNWTAKLSKWLRQPRIFSAVKAVNANPTIPSHQYWMNWRLRAAHLSRANHGQTGS